MPSSQSSQTSQPAYQENASQANPGKSKPSQAKPKKANCSQTADDRIWTVSGQFLGCGTPDRIWTVSGPYLERIWMRSACHGQYLDRIWTVSGPYLVIFSGPQWTVSGPYLDRIWFVPGEWLGRPFQPCILNDFFLDVWTRPINVVFRSLGLAFRSIV